MSAERQEAPVAAPPLSGELLACPSCRQEMAVPIGETNLPLHMDQGKMCAGSALAGVAPNFGVQLKAPLTIPEVANLSISEILSADTCLSCGQKKTPGQTLCTTCHGLLPFLIQKCLPPFIKGYLYADEKNNFDGINKNQFMEVFQSALTTLAQLRSQQ